MYKKYLKQVLDYLFAIILLPILGLLIIIIGFLIKVEDGGPVFFKAKRIGKNFKVYDMYKFRSMYTDSPLILNKDGSTYNSENDTRVTKIGRFIRKTSLDEVPQIINVLKGEMSFIGPRASLETSINSFKQDERDKMKVLPGITGFTQAYYRNSLNNREKRLKDAWYANNLSFILDLRILIKTIFTVLKSENIHTN